MPGSARVPVSDLLPVLPSFFVLVAWIAVLAVFGVVLVVALVRARPEDIPVLVRDAAGVFRRLAERLPGGQEPRHVGAPSGAVPGNDAVADSRAADAAELPATDSEEVR